MRRWTRFVLRRPGLAIATAVMVAALAFLHGVATGHYKWWPFDILWQVRRALAAEEAGASIMARHEPGRADIFRSLPGTASTVMVGDSLTEGGGWTERFPGCRILNRGVSGATVAGVAARLDEILSREPERVFVLIGISDLMAGSDPELLMQDFATIMDSLAAATDLHVFAVLRSGPPRVRHAVDALNARLAEAVAERGITWHDLNPALAGPEGLQPAYTTDGIHLTAAGYAKWADAIRPFLGDCANTAPP